MKSITIERTLGFAKLSIPINAVMAVGKIVISIFTSSIFLLLNAFYSTGIGMAKYLTIKPQIISKKDTDKTSASASYLDAYYIVGVIIILSSICYVLYSITLFFGKEAVQYPMVAGIAIATFTFTELTLSIRGFVLAKKHRNIQMESIKLINIASSFISLALTQTALMSFTFEGDSATLAITNGLCGVVFGTVSCLVGIYMIIYTLVTAKHNKSHKEI